MCNGWSDCRHDRKYPYSIRKFILDFDREALLFGDAYRLPIHHSILVAKMKRRTQLVLVCCIEVVDLPQMLLPESAVLRNFMTCIK